MLKKPSEKPLLIGYRKIPNEDDGLTPLILGENGTHRINNPSFSLLDAFHYRFNSCLSSIIDTSIIPERAVGYTILHPTKGWLHLIAANCSFQDNAAGVKE